jgi:pantetheine-phosphate adenylyltransferase
MNSKKAIYPGSFDPLTLGHLDMIERSLKVFDSLTILVAQNPQKQPLFSISERLEVIKNHFINDPRIHVEAFDGLLVSYMKKHHFQTCIRGLRVLSDFEYEFQMAITNKQLYPSFDVFFLLCDIKYTNLSSTLVKEIIRFNGDVSKYVPMSVIDLIKKKKETSHEF